MGHGVRLLAQVQQGASHAAGDVQERQIAHFAGGGTEATGNLGGDGEQDVSVFTGQLLELGVADFSHFTLGLGLYPRRAGRVVFKQTHFAEEVPFIQVGHDHLATVIIFDHHGHGALQDVIKGIRFIPRINDGAFRWVLASMAVGQEMVQIWNNFIAVSHGRSVLSQKNVLANKTMDIACFYQACQGNWLSLPIIPAWAVP